MNSAVEEDRRNDGWAAYRYVRIWEKLNITTGGAADQAKWTRRIHVWPLSKGI